MADIVVVSIHWGVHHKSEAAMYQIEAGHRMIDAGGRSDLRTPSIVQPDRRKYKGKYIFFWVGQLLALQSGKDPNDRIFRLPCSCMTRHRWGRRHQTKR